MAPPFKRRNEEVDSVASHADDATVTARDIAVENDFDYQPEDSWELAVFNRTFSSECSALQCDQDSCRDVERCCLKFLCARDLCF